MEQLFSVVKELNSSKFTSELRKQFGLIVICLLVCMLIDVEHNRLWTMNIDLRKSVSLLTGSRRMR